MKVFIISDLHISDGRTLCTFGWEQNAFITSLEAIRKKYAIDAVILNGDIFDLYKCKFRKIALHNKDLLDYLRNIDAIFIRGNHDRSHRQGRDHYIIINSSGEKIHIEHGHRADLINGTKLGRGMVKMVYRVIKALSRFARPCKWYFGVVGRLEGFQGARRRKSSRHMRYASRLLRRNDVVILGHTHRIEVRDVYSGNGRKKYCNTGSCSFGRLQGIVLNTETLQPTAISLEPVGYNSFPRMREQAPVVPIFGIAPWTLLKVTRQFVMRSFLFSAVDLFLRV